MLWSLFFLSFDLFSLRSCEPWLFLAPLAWASSSNTPSPSRIRA